MVIGLFNKNGRLFLQGPDAGGNRIMLGRIRITRGANGIEKAAFEEIPEEELNQGPQRADFHAHMNPPGTWAEYGGIGTDGSVKINLAPDALTLFPYPREKAFTIKIDPAALGLDATVPRDAWQVKALAAGTQADLGPVAHTVEDGRIVFSAGMPGAGRYVIMR